MNPAWRDALLGGALIGLAVSFFLWGTGRVAGVSGIFYGALFPKKNDWRWRVAFLLGLINGGILLGEWRPESFGVPAVPAWQVILAGVLVGFGTALGNGCTSGHGVCGLSRLSPRSIAATVTFIVTGIATVAILRFVGSAV